MNGIIRFFKFINLSYGLVNFDNKILIVSGLNFIVILGVG